MTLTRAERDSIDRRTFAKSVAASVCLHISFFAVLSIAMSEVRNFGSRSTAQQSGIGLPSGTLLTDVSFVSWEEGASSDTQPQVHVAQEVPKISVAAPQPPQREIDRETERAEFSYSEKVSVLPALKHTELKLVALQPRQKLGSAGAEVHSVVAPAANGVDDRREGGESAAGSGASGAGHGLQYGSSLSGVKSGVLFGPKPPYPVAARRAGFEGEVVLRVVVDDSGSPQLAEVAQSSGREDCDASAQRTVQNRWQFEPVSTTQQLANERLVVVRYSLNG